MKPYATKPQTIGAMQYDGTNYEAIRNWAGSAVNYVEPEDRTDDPEIEMELLSSAHSNWVGIRKTDWIVLKQGKWMRVNDETFQENYEEIK